MTYNHWWMFDLRTGVKYKIPSLISYLNNTIYEKILADCQYYYDNADIGHRWWYIQIYSNIFKIIRIHIYYGPLLFIDHGSFIKNICNYKLIFCSCYCGSNDHPLYYAYDEHPLMSLHIKYNLTLTAEQNFLVLFIT